MQQPLFQSLPSPTVPAQRWWRLQGDARRRGRSVEPLLVTPRFLARIDVPCCPVTRTPLPPSQARVIPLRSDAAVAAGHLVTLGPVAAAACIDTTLRGWQAAWVQADDLSTATTDRDKAGGLDAPAWRRMAVLLSFVQPLSPIQAGALPLLVLPPTRLRVLSPVQGLQVATTLALQGGDRATRLLRLAQLAQDEDLRLALRVFALTLLARCPTDLDRLDDPARRVALEDLWLDPLLQRRWQRLASRLTDAQATDLLQRARRRQLLGRQWRPLDNACATDGWALAERSALESNHAQDLAPPEHRLAPAVLAAGGGGDGADVAAPAAGRH